MKLKLLPILSHLIHLLECILDVVHVGVLSAVILTVSTHGIGIQQNEFLNPGFSSHEVTSGG
jgi:hypothetical protein